MDKIEKSLERLKLASQMSETYYEKPLIITTSGGKDSDVCINLALKAGIAFEVHHNHTTVDAPETVYHIRRTMYDLELKGIKCVINTPFYKEKPVTMWSLIESKGFPPTRIFRYCCDVLKEQGGKDRMIVTGVRWAESMKRKNRATFETFSKKKENRILLNDNDDKRTLFENCKLKAKRICNPIIDWKDDEIWDYIKMEKINVCNLYERGHNRIGCIGCPFISNKKRIKSFLEYPTYKKAYIRAFDGMLQNRIKRELKSFWKNGEEVFNWWTENGIIAGQISFDNF